MSIIIKNLNHTYMGGTPFEVKALSDINLTINDSEFIGIIGHTGSGKSTLIQHFNALLKPTSGSIIVNDVDITSKKSNLKKVRGDIGLVFQYPEYQLFEETVMKDVSFGPKNIGYDDALISEKVNTALELVGLNVEEFGARSPFELSGGQRRRVAMAGVLAMDPDVLILDEPTAGLDPLSRTETLELLKRIHGQGKTVIMVSHDMDAVAELCQRVMVMHEGSLVKFDTPQNIYADVDGLLAMGLTIPRMTQVAQKLKSMGIQDVPDGILTGDDLFNFVTSRLKAGESNA